jgi:hypothetical protein
MENIRKREERGREKKKQVRMALKRREWTVNKKEITK